MNFQEIALVASAISYNRMDEIQKEKRLTVFQGHEWIAKVTIEFCRDHQGIKDWADFLEERNEVTDWEDYVIWYVDQKLKAA